jgi:O-antigen/teichoic acid export membrane protein
VIWCLALWKPWLAVSLTLGVALGTAVLASFAYIIPKIIVPGANKPQKSLIKFTIAKYLLIGVGLFFLVEWKQVNLLAFCGGIVLVHAAILAKFLGAQMLNRQTENIAPPTGKVTGTEES